MNGDTIRKLRMNAGLTQKQLAERLGYMTNGQPNRSHIARIEGNHQQVTERLFFAVQWVCSRHNYGLPLMDERLLGTQNETVTVTTEGVTLTTKSIGAASDVAITMSDDSHIL
jgi:DNA-binding XRE family transcriptional regulator